MADAVGPALLVVLESLAPAERLVFVLYDLFAVAFEFTIVDGRIAEIALVADPERIRQLDPSVLEG